MTKKQRDCASGLQVYEPTPRDVRRACAEIQATWSPRERTQRTKSRLSELVAAINGDRPDGPRNAAKRRGAGSLNG